MLLSLSFLLLLLPAARPADSTAYTVCVVLESGFTMLREGVGAAEAVRSDAQLRGFDVELREHALAGRNYTVRVLSTYGEVEVRTRRGECDVGWAQFFQLASRVRCSPDPTTCRDPEEAGAGAKVTSWGPYRCCARYSPNLFPFDIKILSFDQGETEDFFEAFFSVVKSAFFINFMSFTLLVGSVFTHLVWFAERHPNAEQFPPRYLDGIDDGFWWAAVTFSTVGYGDKAPITPFGRLLAVAWMIIGVTLCSILTGHMATSFYASKEAGAAITSAADLAGLRVCGYEGTFKSWYLPSSVPFTPVIRDSVAACGALMRTGEADATVMESPMLGYWMKADPWAAETRFVLSPALTTVPMGMVYSNATDIADYLDLTLIELFETATVRDMQSRWFGEGANPRKSSGGEQVDWRLLGPAIALVSVYVAGMTYQSWSRKENPCNTCFKGRQQEGDNTDEITREGSPTRKTTMRSGE